MFALLARVRCLFGFHPWGKWVYMDPSSCSQGLVCELCEQFKPGSSVVVHAWTDPQFAKEFSCEIIHRCFRCNTIKLAVPPISHSFDGYTYVSSNNCLMGKICERCHFIDPESWITQHVFSDWISALDACLEFRSCKRCNSEDSQEKHIWVPRPYGKTCSRCSVTKDIEVGTCFQCGQRAIPGDNVCYSCV